MLELLCLTFPPILGSQVRLHASRNGGEATVYVADVNAASLELDPRSHVFLQVGPCSRCPLKTGQGRHECLTSDFPASFPTNQQTDRRQLRWA